MKYYIFTILTVLLLLTGCRSDFDWRLNRLDDYGKEFVAQYGWPDSRQNWNTAIQYQVTADIAMGGSWTMKVYSADPIEEPHKAYLLGKYDINATDGPVTVNVDGPYTLETICIGIEDGDVCARKNIPTNKEYNIEADFEEKDLLNGSLPSAKKMSYLIAYEIVDSASTFLDFNDIVLEVEHVSGENTANIRLRAVGAMENMAISYQNGSEKTVLYEDAHLAFGYHKTDRVVNVITNYHDYRTPIKYNNLEVGQDFSIVDGASRFVVSLPTGKKGRTLDFALRPNSETYVGTPTNVLVVANPTWDWLSEGSSYNMKRSSFTFWLKSYHLYNQWWDNLWDPHELILEDDGSYVADFDYTKVWSIKDIEKNGGSVPEIGYQLLKPYLKEEIGANIGFVVTGREGGSLSITLVRADGGGFEWYEGKDAYVNVFENYNIDCGRGYAETCHILLSTKTMQDIVDCKTSLRVVFDSKDTDAKINSVWIRGR